MIYAMIILYNKKIDDSITYSFFKKYKNNIEILIFDNGKEEFVEYNNEYCKNNKIHFYTLNKNVGISKAYNYVLDKIDIKEDNYIIVLDDDTILDDCYVKEAFNLIKQGKGDVLLPIITANNKIISPSKVQFNCRIKKTNNINSLKKKNITAINSGMIVKTTVYRKIKYNEEIFLDYVDHDFMKKVRNSNYNIYIMNSKIKQNYSRFKQNELKSEIFRFKIYLKDFKTYCKECNNLIFYHLSVFKYKLTECIKYKNIKFIILK